jgi:hypothetical protein
MRGVTSYRPSPAWYIVTIVETFARLVKTRRLRQYSSAVDASSPRVELSQQPTAPRVTIVSAIETRFFSPPETPRMNYISTATLKAYLISNTSVKSMFNPKDPRKNIKECLPVLTARHPIRTFPGGPRLQSECQSLLDRQCRIMDIILCYQRGIL